jgi:MinD-like ATPase involved in chromosome partitioning or flagellar assembly
VTVIVVTAGKGSPGVTTTTLAVAGAWPAGIDVAVCELDAGGGDLAARYGLSGGAGLARLAAARDGSPARLFEHATPLAGRAVPASVAPSRAEPATAAIREACRWLLPAWRSARDLLVVADCGRWWSGSPCEAAVQLADVVLVVVRQWRASTAATVGWVDHAADAITQLRAARVEPALVVIGSEPYPPEEIAAWLGCDLAGVVADDRDAADMLAGRPGSPRALARSRLWRSCAVLAGSLAERVEMAVAVGVER